MSKLNRKSFSKLIEDLEETKESKEEALDNANDAEYPNEERIDKLENECNLLDEMISLVQEYIDLE